MAKVRINSAKLQATLMELSTQAAGRAANVYREKLREEISASGRINTGEMFTNIRIEPGPPGTQSATWRVIPEADHFRFQDQGTNGVPARPGRVLRFKPKGSGVFVFAKSTKGISAANFLRKTAARMRPNDFAK